MSNVYSYEHINKVGLRMELQIQDLVNSIKRDGIEEAEKKAPDFLTFTGRLRLKPA
jgi:Txe/YoeB family toxin of Txe-Axe toxin-antitoxin module